MLATMTTVGLLDETDKLGKAIIQSDVFADYVMKKQQLQADGTAQQLIRRFNEMKLQHEEVQRFGRYHPDYKTVSAEIRKLKREMDVNPSVAAFRKAERELESLLNEVSGLIAHAVSDTIKVPTGNPFFDNMSCSGGCGSGQGCSCG